MVTSGSRVLMAGLAFQPTLERENPVVSQSTHRMKLLQLFFMSLTWVAKLLASSH